jgi:hypothetical protein
MSDEPFRRIALKLPGAHPYTAILPDIVVMDVHYLE